MGYSCTAAAGFTRDAIVAELAKLGVTGSNGMPGGGFFERGRENADGAITGTVWRAVDETHVTHRGSYRINADGKVVRFPGLPRELLRRAEIEGERKFIETFGPHDDPDWRDVRRRILACLDDGLPVSYLWDDLQALARSYQTDQKMAFLALPELNAAAFRSFLEAL